MATPSAPARVLVVGTGLMGTSVALALRDRGTDVWLSDLDADTARLAAGLGAGTVVPDLRDAKGIADVAVLAMPPEAVAATLGLAQDFGVAQWYTDVASVKSLPVSQARALGCDLGSYVPGHPLAGRERQGPAAARADLFLGRTWALCPLPETSADAVRAVAALASACGADVVTTDAATHDRWVALMSHAPHLVAAAMAARLAPSSVSDDALRLAGQGLRDVTRIAAGDPALWTQILSANAVPVAEVIAAIADDLSAAARTLSLASGPAAASSSASVSGPAVVPGSAPVSGPAVVPGSAPVSGSAVVPGGASVSGSAVVPGGASVSGSAVVPGGASVSGSAVVPGGASVSGSAVVPGGASVPGPAVVPGGAPVPVPNAESGPLRISADISDISNYGGLLKRGQAGAARIPGKRGGEARAFAVVQVVIADRPGELARLFSAAGEAGVNVEDVRIEHSPGHPTGVAEISVRPDQAAALLAAVTAGGWSARR